MCASVSTVAKNCVITIDGPAGSGKSCLARLLADKLGFVHLNSGLLYRAAAKLLCSAELLTADKLPPVDGFLQTVDLAKLEQIKLVPVAHSFAIFVEGQDWSQLLHTEELDRASAWLAATQTIRDFVLHKQQETARGNDLVIDGRDCGTVVFPQANVKIFLTASSHARALRIAKRSKVGHDKTLLAQIEADIARRDVLDRERLVSPLKPAEDAVILDNSNFSVAQTLDSALRIVAQQAGYA